MMIQGNLKITTADGTILEDRNDIDLAWKWAKHEINRAVPSELNYDLWDHLPFQIQQDIYHEALFALREIHEMRRILEPEGDEEDG